MTKARTAYEMDEKIKIAVAEALVNAGLPTKDDLSNIISNLEKKIMELTKFFFSISHLLEWGYR